MFLVENFIHNLVRRKCNFDIIFFESNADICVPRLKAHENRSKYLLARRVIFAHLQTHLPAAYPATKILSFQSIQDTAFKAYLKAQKPYFIMCHDGAGQGDSVSLNIQTDNANGTNPQDDRVEVSRKTRLRTMIYDFLVQGYNAALVNGLDWVDTKVSFSNLLMKFC